MAQSNLPTVTRLKYEDYADAKDWQTALQQLINALNLFIGPVYTLLNGQVTYQNLTIPQLYSQKIVGASPTIFNFVNPLIIQPSAVILGNVYIVPNPNQHPAVATQVYWHCSQNIIYVDDIVGLTPGINYFVELVIL